MLADITLNTTIVVLLSILPLDSKSGTWRDSAALVRSMRTLYGVKHLKDIRLAPIWLGDTELC